MKRATAVLLFSLVLFLNACATNPFPKARLVDISERDPQVVIKEFGDNITQNFEALQSITINFFGKKMTGLGYISVDQKTRSFNLTCMSPMGISLLSIQKDPNGLNAEFSFSEEFDHPEVLEEMARNISQIYFDWTPTPSAALKRSRYKFIFTQKNQDGGNTKFVFGGNNTYLIKKDIRSKDERVVIQYHNYQMNPQALYPEGIFLKNKKYHYTLVIKTREFYVN